MTVEVNVHDETAAGRRCAEQSAVGQPAVTTDVSLRDARFRTTRGGHAMQIRAGYDIAYECPQPTPMLLVLSVHPSRQPDLLTPHRITLRPAGPSRDLPRRLRQRLHADRSRRPGDSRSRPISSSATPACPTRSIRTARAARRSRSCRTTCSSSCSAAATARPTGSSDIAWSLFGDTPPGWARVQAICDYVHDRITFGYQHARATRTAWDGYNEQHGRLPRLRPSRRSRFCRCMNIPARYCTGYLGDIGVPPVDRPDGFQRLVRGLSRRALVHLRRPPQHAAHRPHPDGARPRRHRRRDLDQLRVAQLAKFEVVTDEVKA